MRILAAACPSDLLTLTGTFDAEVVRVESLEMPTRATRIDNLLRLRDAAGRIYLHLLEWQGYRDPTFLWRILTYLGQNFEERPLAVTLFYLFPQADTGDALRQEIEEQLNWEVRFRTIRLWEQDASAAIRSGLPGLAALSPLMRGATAATVEEAARVVLAGVRDPQRQADTLSALGVLVEPLMAADRFVAMIGRDRVMASELLTFLLREKLEEMEQERAAIQHERERVAAIGALASAVEEAISVRFPTAPLTLATALHRIQDPRQLQELLSVTLKAPDLATVQRAVESVEAD